MISEPYNIKPTLPMYNKYIVNLIMRQNLLETLPLMREAKTLVQESYRYYRTALNASLTALDLARKIGNEHSTAQASLFELQRKLERARMRRARNYNYVKRWVRLLLGGRRWSHRTRSYHRDIPNAIEEWRPFLPDKATYSMRTGTVELNIKSTAISTRRFLRGRRYFRGLKARRRPVEWKSYGGVGSYHTPS